MAKVVPVMVTTTLTAVVVLVSVTQIVAGLSPARTITPLVVGHLAVAGPALTAGTPMVVGATIMTVANRIRRSTVRSSPEATAPQRSRPPTTVEASPGGVQCPREYSATPAQGCPSTASPPEHPPVCTLAHARA